MTFCSFIMIFHLSIDRCNKAHYPLLSYITYIWSVHTYYKLEKKKVRFPLHWRLLFVIYYLSTEISASGNLMGPKLILKPVLQKVYFLLSFFGCIFNCALYGHHSSNHSGNFKSFKNTDCVIDQS